MAAPILAYLGEESSLDDDHGGIGWLTDNAHRFKALEVYIEHRFYGKSVPFVPSKDALKNATLRGYFNSAQALADYAEILLHIKKNLSAEMSPTIVVGASYGGMLVAWFRLKYPDIALGAVASSAPILYFDNITPSNAFYDLVSKDFREASESCYKTIKQSWLKSIKPLLKKNGLTFLSKKFKTCKPLKDVSELKDYLESMYTSAAQYDDPQEYPVNKACNGIDGASEGTDTLGRIFSGIVALRGESSCYDTCSEMVSPIKIGKNDTTFQANPFNPTESMDSCNKSYGVVPRPHWITTYCSGHDIRMVLNRFGSNIIFSNGLRNPYSSAGVLKDISDNIIAVTTRNRNIEADTVHDWILKYSADLLQNQNTRLYCDYKISLFFFFLSSIFLIFMEQR
ncbi:prolylcarboxypeptidase-like protein [Citrus sinensis]|nr:prolylcarboxypeptidase-like protein [Citrus sinensis]